MTNETLDDFLLHCSLYEKQRKEMFEFLSDCGITLMENSSFTEACLLAPVGDTSFSKRHNSIIKTAFFEFLEKANRTI